MFHISPLLKIFDPCINTFVCTGKNRFVIVLLSTIIDYDLCQCFHTESQTTFMNPEHVNDKKKRKER